MTVIIVESVNVAIINALICSSSFLNAFILFYFFVLLHYCYTTKIHIILTYEQKYIFFCEIPLFIFILNNVIILIKVRIHVYKILFNKPNKNIFFSVFFWSYHCLMKVQRNMQIKSVKVSYLYSFQIRLFRFILNNKLTPHYIKQPPLY